jgi:transposase
MNMTRNNYTIEIVTVSEERHRRLSVQKKAALAKKT